MKALAIKILKVQSEVGALTKDQNGYGSRYKYFDINQLLAQLQPILESNGLCVLQPLVTYENKPGINTIVVDTESGETHESIVTFDQDKDPQKVGSCITYYRRYALQSLFALQAEDDDGHKAKAKTLPEFTQESFDKWASSEIEGKPSTAKEMRKFFTVSDDRAKKIEEQVDIESIL